MRRKVFAALTTALLLTSVFAVVAVTPVMAKKLTVDDDPGADYTSIQDAISAAGEGAEILVYPGDYYGPIEISKEGIKLKSTEGPSVTIVHQGSWPFDTPTGHVWWWYVGIAVLADHVTVEGFTVRDDTDPDYGARGIHFNSPGIIIGDHRGPFGGPGYTATFATPVSHCRVKGNVVEHNAQGIYLFNAQQCHIEKNVVRNQMKDSHIGQGGDGIILWDDGYLQPGNIHNQIYDNSVYGNEHVGIFAGTWNPPRTASCDGTHLHKNDARGNLGTDVMVTYATGKVNINNNCIGTFWMYESPDVNMQKELCKT